jgi:hypothetical protein
MTEAGLFIHPITYDDYGIPNDEEEEEPHLDEHLNEPVTEPLIENTDVNNNLEAERIQREIAPSIETQTSNQDLSAALSNDELDDDEIIRRALEEDVSDEFDADMQRRIEEMIDSVISAAKEDADWLRETQASSENIQVSTENIQVSNENIRVSVENLEASAENVQASMENIETSTENLQLSHEIFKNSIENIEETQIKKFNYLPVESCVKVEITQSEDVPEIEADIELAEEVSMPEPAPLPPPRRRSTTTVEESSKQEASATVETLPSIDESQIEPEIEEQPQNLPKQTEVQRQDTFEGETFSSQLPTRLHLSSLEIDNLSVCSLQAGRITASEIDSNTIVTNEFDCKVSSNLPNSRSIEFPPGFIDEIVERVRCASRAEQRAESDHQLPQSESVESQQQSKDEPPVRPPLPSQFHSEYSSVPPPSFYQLRDYSEDDALHQAPHRRRRHQTKRKDSTSEEDYQRDHRSKGGRAGTSDQSILGLGGQFARACGSALKESGDQMMAILRASSKDENKRDLHIALIILIVICAGLILMGMGDKSVHHHHWDFFNPPDNHGRL